MAVISEKKGPKDSCMSCYKLKGRTDLQWCFFSALEDIITAAVPAAQVASRSQLLIEYRESRTEIFARVSDWMNCSSTTDGDRRGWSKVLPQWGPLHLRSVGSHVSGIGFSGQRRPRSGHPCAAEHPGLHVLKHEV